MPVRLVTWIGVFEFVVVPLPSWPEPLSPHDHCAPALVAARLWSEPPAMAMTPVGEVRWTGLVHVLPQLPPSPSWPLLFRPHDQTVPSAAIASAWPPPAAIAEMPLTETCTGVVDFL